MAITIDSHQHFWNRSLPFRYEWLDAPGHEAIRGDFLPDDLEPLLDASQIDRSIFVQTQHDLAENRWALALADRHPFLAGVVGWVDLASPDCERQLLEFRGHPKFVGIRHVTQDEPDDHFIVGDRVMRGLGVLQKHEVPFDLLFYVKHLRHAAPLARALPDLPMVIDHLAKPRIKDRAFDDWLPQFREAASFPNVYCKLSGLVSEAGTRHWSPDDLKPYVQIALDLFGPDRLMFGSDWPVCNLVATYPTVVDGLKAALGPLSDSENDKIFGLTAARFYRLDLESTPEPEPR